MQVGIFAVDEVVHFAIYWWQKTNYGNRNEFRRGGRRAIIVFLEYRSGLRKKAEELAIYSETPSTLGL